MGNIMKRIKFFLLFPLCEFIVVHSDDIYMWAIDLIGDYEDYDIASKGGY